jgi:hypothetical protein
VSQSVATETKHFRRFPCASGASVRQLCEHSLPKSGCVRQPGADRGLQCGFGRGHPAVAHGLVFGRIGLDLGAIERDVAELDQTRLPAQRQHLQEERKSPASAARWRFLKSLMVRKSGRAMAVSAMKSRRSSHALVIRCDE